MGARWGALCSFPKVLPTGNESVDAITNVAEAICGEDTQSSSPKKVPLINLVGVHLRISVA